MHGGAIAAIRESVLRRRSESMQLLSDLVRIPTVSGHEDQAESLLAGWFGENQWAVERQILGDSEAGRSPRGLVEPRKSERANVMGWLRASTGRPVVTINAHYDVVPVIDPDDWLDEPFSAVQRDGALYGRGAVDNKAGCVTAMYALQAIADAGIELAFDLAVEFVVGEETTGLGTLATLERFPARIATVVMEPTSSAVISVNSGALFFTIGVDGRAVHTSVPWLGEDALAKLLTIYQKLNELGDRRAASHRHPLMEHLPSSVPIVIGMLAGGGWRAAVPGHATMSGRIGVLPDEPLAAVRAELHAVVDEVADSDSWLKEHRPIVTWDNDGLPGWQTPVESDLVQSFLFGQHAAGRESRIEGLTTGCDAGVLFRSGITVVVFGPGDLARAHSPNEYVREDEVIEATTILAASLVELSRRVRGGGE